MNPSPSPLRQRLDAVFAYYNPASMGAQDSQPAAALDLPAWRQRILVALLYAVAIVGAVALLVALIPLLQRQNYLLAAAYGAAYGLIVVLAFSRARVVRELPYWVKGGVLVAFPVAAGVADLLQYGLTTSVVAWFFASALLAAILFGMRWASIIGGLQLVTLVIFAILITNRLWPVPTPNPLVSSLNPLAWLVGVFNYIYLSALAIVGLVLLLRGLEQSLKAATQLSARLEVEQARLTQRTEDLERRLVQIRTASEIAQRVSAGLSPDALLQNIVDLIQERLNLHYVGAFVYESPAADTTQTAGMPGARLRAGSGVIGRSLAAEGKALVMDEASDPNQEDAASVLAWALRHGQSKIGQVRNPSAPDEASPTALQASHLLPETKTEMAVPFTMPVTASQSGVFGPGSNAAGVLTIQSTQPDAFDENDITLMEGIADVLSTALQNAWMVQTTQRRLEVESAVSYASGKMREALDMQTILQTAAREMRAAFDLDEVTIQLGLPEQPAGGTGPLAPDTGPLSESSQGRKTPTSPEDISQPQEKRDAQSF